MLIYRVTDISISDSDPLQSIIKYIDRKKL